MTRAVVYGIDDSAGATSAARFARMLAERFELPLLFVHVVRPGAGEEGVVAAAGLLREAVDGVAPDGCARLTIETGHPADRLVAFARQQEASFVVVVGYHGPRSSLLGSISGDVSREASAPVGVVPSAAFERQVREAGDPSVAGGIVRFDLRSSPMRGA
jgi:nucleotide-binding universal stress UspA family protein